MLQSHVKGVKNGYPLAIEVRLFCLLKRRKLKVIMVLHVIIVKSSKINRLYTVYPPLEFNRE